MHHHSKIIYMALMTYVPVVSLYGQNVESRRKNGASDASSLPKQSIVLVISLIFYRVASFCLFSVPFSGVVNGSFCRGFSLSSKRGLGGPKIPALVRAEIQKVENMTAV